MTDPAPPVPESIPSASAVLTPEAVGEDPRVSPTIPGGETVPGKGFTPNEADIDRHGTPFDPTIHEHALKKDGSWRGKRGNGKRKLDGKPLAMPGPDKSTVYIPTTSHGPAPAPGGANHGPLSTPGQVGAVDAMQLSPADYQTTGNGVFRALFCIMRLIFGKAWEPTTEEEKAWPDCLARIWFAYQLPRLGGWPELATLAAGSVAKRSDDPKTAGVLRRFGSWLMGKKIPKEDKPDPAVQKSANDQ
jgi:hypothetical protein